MKILSKGLIYGLKVNKPFTSPHGCGIIVLPTKHEEINMKAQIVLDIACNLIYTDGKVTDFRFDDGALFSSNNSSLEFEVINAEGPGGGWPEIKIIGEEEELKIWIRKEYAYSDEDYEFISSYIETVK